MVDLEVGFPPMLERYTSEVTFKRPWLVRARSRHGTLFNDLRSEWRFSDVKKDDDDDDHALHKNRCKIDFTVEFEFKSPLMSRMGNLVFDQTARQTMDAFLRRARHVYGDPSDGR